MTTTATKDPNILLAEWGRRNKDTKADELLRVQASPFNGDFYLSLRTFYRVSPEYRKGPDDSGWRPDKFRGVTIRMSELDELAAAIEDVRRLAAGAGERPPARDERRDDRRPAARPYHPQGQHQHEPRDPRRPPFGDGPRPGPARPISPAPAPAPEAAPPARSGGYATIPVDADADDAPF